MKQKVAVLVGPTAVGKTDVSLEVAERLGAEIVSADSMQTYRGMDIGTAKPDSSALQRVRHHLIDVYDPEHTVTVAGFQANAREAISDIGRRGRLALLVGGSGLYVRAVIDDLEIPGTSQELRDSLIAEAQSLGVDVLYERLTRLDPVAASKIDPANERRIVRALEVIELTGRAFSENDAWDAYDSIFEVAIVGLRRERPILHQRIASRVATMLDRGLEAEAKVLGPRLGRTARQALGYKQILDMPGASRQELEEAIVKATKRFARRQESWFKADPRVEWFDAEMPDLSEAIARHLSASLTLPLEA